MKYALIFTSVLILAGCATPFTEYQYYNQPGIRAGAPVEEIIVDKSEVVQELQKKEPESGVTVYSVESAKLTTQ